MDVLLPARFLSVVGHLMITIMVYYSKDGNVRRAMPLRDISNYDHYNSRVYADVRPSMVVALALTWICFAIELGTLLSGVTMFNRLSGLISYSFHLAFRDQISDYTIYWSIFFYCNFIPALSEITLTARHLFVHL
ncbi:hypothetical protein HK101_007275 [Irineochytrium annulatum]|nr:hypothetical protein HK101_007275 [Irineochytrium annulatum]